MKKTLIVTAIVLTLIGVGYHASTQVPKAVGGDALLVNEEQLFAHVDPDTSIVDSVIVITQENMDANGGWYVSGVFKPRNEWVQTSNNGTVRKNYAGKGYSYDAGREAFIAPKPTSTAVLDETTAKWKEAVLICDGFASTTCHY